MLRLLRQLGSSIADAALGAMDQAQHADWLDKPSSAAPLPVAAAAQREKLRKTLASRSGLDLISEQIVDGWQLADDEFAVRAQAAIPAAMVITSRRLLFGAARDGLILPLAKITKIETTRSLLESQLRVSLKPDRTEKIPAGTDGAALRDVIERAAALARQELAALTEPRENKKNDAPISEGDRRYRDLLKLTALRDNDVLSADEYERERRRLLDVEPRR